MSKKYTYTTIFKIFPREQAPVGLFEGDEQKIYGHARTELVTTSYILDRWALRYVDVEKVLEGVERKAWLNSLKTFKALKNAYENKDALVMLTEFKRTEKEVVL